MAITETSGAESDTIPEVNSGSKNPAQALIPTAASINTEMKTGWMLFNHELGGEINAQV